MRNSNCTGEALRELEWRGRALRIWRRGHRLRDALTGEQELELICGPAGKSAFASDAERRSAWFTYRDQVMADINAGARPWAQCQYDTPQIEI